MNRSYAMLAICGLAVCAFTGCGGDERDLSGTWHFAVDSTAVGEREAWFETAYDRSQWTEATVPGVWDDFGLDGYDGVGWFARWLTDLESVPVSLVFSGVDDDATVWINGVLVGSHSGYSDPFSVTVPDSLRSDSMLVVVRVVDHAGPGGIYKRVAAVPTADVEEYMRSPYARKDARVSPAWVQAALIYEVYLRSFSEAGTFQALEDRLPELRSLGVNVIWLMPIHPIGELNRKGRLGSPYSISDYTGINPELGTIDDFRRLVDAVHAQGMKIIIDLVANHTAWDSDLLLQHADWYTRDEDGAIVAPNADWSDVADLNYDRHELRKYMVHMIRYWVEDVGIDGYRCDVAALVPTDFWDHVRNELDGIKPVLMLAESSEPEHHLSAFDITYASATYDILDPLFAGEVGASAVTRILRNESLRYPSGSLLLRFHTNHDKNAWDAPAVAKWGEEGVKLAATMMYMLPGVPLLYNGEEVGNTKTLPLFNAVPIDWSSGPSFRAHFEKLGTLRRNFPWLATAPWREVEQTISPNALLLMRSDEESGAAVLAVLNFGSSTLSIDIPIPAEFKDRALIDRFTAARIPPSKRLVMSLPPRGSSVLSVSRERR